MTDTPTPAAPEPTCAFKPGDRPDNLQDCHIMLDLLELLEAMTQHQQQRLNAAAFLSTPTLPPADRDREILAEEYERDGDGHAANLVRKSSVAFSLQVRAMARARAEATVAAPPVPMILHCPACQLQHIDAPDDRTPDWTNPPHRSHLCHGCGCIWRPSDVPTEGVATIATRGKSDTWPEREP